VFSLKRVPYVMDADNVTFTTLGCAVHTQETNNIAVVGVEELPRRGPVDAYARNLRRVVSNIFDMAEDMTAAVLGEEITQVRAQSHVCDGCLVGAPERGGKMFEKNKPLAVKQVVAQDGEDFTEFDKREILFADSLEGNSRGDERVRGGSQFGNLFVGKRVDPALRTVDEVFALPDSGAGDFLGESRVGLQNVIEGRVLAGCADPIGEDGSGSIMVVLPGDGGVMMMFIDENSRSHCCLYLGVKDEKRKEECQRRRGEGEGYLTEWNGNKMI